MESLSRKIVHTTNHDVWNIVYTATELGPRLRAHILGGTRLRFLNAFEILGRLPPKEWFE